MAQEVRNRSGLASRTRPRAPSPAPVHRRLERANALDVLTRLPLEQRDQLALLLTDDVATLRYLAEKRLGCPCPTATRVCEPCDWKSSQLERRSSAVSASSL